MRTVVAVASGPSLTVEQCALAAEAQRAGRCRIVVVNDNWARIPTADVLYACDARWYRAPVNDKVRPLVGVPPGTLNVDAVRKLFGGASWTHRPILDRRPGNRVEREQAEFLIQRPWINAADVGLIGGNSGAQAIELARLLFAPRTVILIGYDMQRTNDAAHWFGDHEKPLTQGVPTSWIRRFDELALAWAARGMSVINCSEATALTRFPRADLRDALAMEETLV